MSYKLSLAFGLAALATTVFAQNIDNPDSYFSKRNPPLSATEQKAIGISEQFLNGGSTAMPPSTGSSGAVSFVFGATAPSIVCAVLQVCDVELQAGEQVNSVNLGDTARWLVEPAVSGAGASETQHLIIKPLDVGLETNLVVTTDRRTYHIQLRSHRTAYMARVVFTYPEDAAAKWRAVARRAEATRAASVLPTTGQSLDALAFNYAIDGAAPWKPVRVYNDGVKTIIEMPRAMQQTEAPSLLVVRKDGDPKNDADKLIVNYRLQGDRFIVDQVFDKAVLIAGVGKHQDRVVITREQ
jgi:type IV secretion system protein TrbG